MNRYLVTGSFLDPGPLLDEAASQAIASGCTLPSQQALDRLERSGAIAAGGVFVGARKVVFVADVPSNDALHALIAQLPFWRLLDWEIVPLQRFEQRARTTKEQSGR